MRQRSLRSAVSPAGNAPRGCRLEVPPMSQAPCVVVTAVDMGAGASQLDAQLPGWRTALGVTDVERLDELSRDHAQARDTTTSRPARLAVLARLDPDSAGVATKPP
jgi:hypothetical protein